jgi:hypothetical protein
MPICAIVGLKVSGYVLGSPVFDSVGYIAVQGIWFQPPFCSAEWTTLVAPIYVIPTHLFDASRSEDVSAAQDICDF